MGGSSKSKKMSFAQNTASSTSGPAQWMQDEGQTLYNQAKSQIPTTYTPYTGERVADYGTDYSTARGLAESAATPSGDLSSTRSILDQLRGTVDPNASVESYMNPYTGAVLDPSIRKIVEASNLNRNRLDAQATLSGAFGDSSHGVQQALNQRNTEQTIGDTTNKTYSDAFLNAQNQQKSALDRLMGVASGYTGLSNATDAHSKFINDLLMGFADRDRAIAQAKNDVGYQNYAASQAYAPQVYGYLEQLLSGTPHETTTNQTGTSIGNSTETKPDTGLMDMGGKLLGGLFGSAPVSGAIGSALSAILP